MEREREYMTTDLSVRWAIATLLGKTGKAEGGFQVGVGFKRVWMIALFSLIWVKRENIP